MISQDIKYTDFDGEEVTKKFWFHLNKLEVAEVHLQDDLQEVVQAKDAVRSLRAMKRLLRHAVCLRMGDRISKPEELGDEFVASDAYSEFILDLMRDEKGPERMSEFIRGVAPFVDKVGAQAVLPISNDTKEQ